MIAGSADTPGQGVSENTTQWLPLGMGMVVLFVLFVLGFLPSIRWIAGEWSSGGDDLSHGFLITAISMYLVVRAMPQAAMEDRRTTWLALPPLLGLSIVWLLGYVATVAAVQTVVLPLILYCAATFVFGFRITRHFAFPILFLYFALPAVEHLKFVFQEITIVAVHAMISLTDISAYVEGKHVFIPEGTFAIESGCSGLNFAVSGVALSALYGYLYYDNWLDRAKLVLLALLVAMAGNWIRVFVIVNIGYYQGMDVSLVADHLWLGWLIFAVLMVPVFIIAMRFENDTAAPDDSDSRQAPTVSGKAPVAVMVVAAAAMLLGPVWAAVAVEGWGESEEVAITLPEDLPGWRGPMASLWNWQPKYVGVSAERLAEYKNSESTILAYSNVYLKQAQGGELVFHKNSIINPWLPNIDSGVDSILDIEGAGVFQKTIVNSPYGPWMILHRNVVGGKAVIGDLNSKFEQSLASLVGRPEAGVIAYAMQCIDSCVTAQDELTEFVAALGENATLRFEYGSEK